MKDAFSEEYLQYSDDRYGNRVETELYVMLTYLDETTYAAVCAEAGISPESGSPILQNYIRQVYYTPTENSRRTYAGSVLDSGVQELAIFLPDGIPGYRMTGAYSQEEDGSWTAEYGQNLQDIYWQTHEASSEPECMVRPAVTEKFRFGATMGESKINTAASYGLALYLPMSALPEEDPYVGVYVTASNMEKAHETMIGALQKADPGFREDDLLDAHETERNMRNVLTIIRVFSYGFITLISLICVANVFNTISTNVALRRRDFAMLRSVGMTQGGIYRMMGYECLLYGLWALALGLPLSAGVAYLIWRAAGEISSSSFRLPWMSVLVAVVSVFLVVFVSMLYAVGKLRRDNPVETLKEENV